MGRTRVKQSSAKSLTFEETIDGRSLICKINNIGPKTMPCGTPESTSTGLEDDQLRHTVYDLLEN